MCSAASARCCACLRRSAIAARGSASAAGARALAPAAAAAGGGDGGDANARATREPRRESRGADELLASAPPPLLHADEAAQPGDGVLQEFVALEARRDGARTAGDRGAHLADLDELLRHALAEELAERRLMQRVDLRDHVLRLLGPSLRREKLQRRGSC